MRPRSATWLRSAALPLGLAPALALLVDCNLVIGAGNYQATCGEFAFTAPGCEPCIQSSCCAAAEACRASRACAPLFDCLSVCGAEDVDCRSQCYAASRTFDDPARAMIVCEQTKCTSVCLGCGNLGLGITGACAECFDTHCCAETTACVEDAVCGAGFAHFGVCADPACTLDELPARVAYQNNAVAAAQQACAMTSCNIAACSTSAFAWACVSKYAFQAPQDATPPPLPPFPLVLTDYLDVTTGIPGAQIRACPGQDVGCAAPITAFSYSAPTPGTYLLSNVPEGFDGYFEITFGDDYTPILAYPGLPVTQEALAALAAIHALFAWSALPTKPTSIFDALLGLAGIGAAQAQHTAAVNVGVFDCFFRQAAGVALAGPAGAGATAFYFVPGGTPSINLPTTQSGGGGGIVVPMVSQDQLTTVTGTLVSTGQVVAERAVVVRPNTLTEIAYLAPLAGPPSAGP